jgi:DNA primase
LRTAASSTASTNRTAAPLEEELLEEELLEEELLEEELLEELLLEELLELLEDELEELFEDELLEELEDELLDDELLLTGLTLPLSESAGSFDVQPTTSNTQANASNILNTGILQIFKIKTDLILRFCAQQAYLKKVFCCLRHVCLGAAK